MDGRRSPSHNISNSRLAAALRDISVDFAVPIGVSYYCSIVVSALVVARSPAATILLVKLKLLSFHISFCCIGSLRAVAMENPNPATFRWIVHFTPMAFVPPLNLNDTFPDIPSIPLGVTCPPPPSTPSPFFRDRFYASDTCLWNTDRDMTSTMAANAVCCSQCMLLWMRLIGCCSNNCRPRILPRYVVQSAAPWGGTQGIFFKQKMDV